MKTYFRNFFGKRLAAALSRRNIFIGQGGDGSGMEYAFCASVSLETA